ncbi:hypothetical protein pb186bvf_016848 [Paramecium bursaria]
MTQVDSIVKFQYVKDPAEMNLSWTDFMFAVRIEQDDFIDNPYYNITVEQRKYIRFENGSQIQKPKRHFNLVPCTLGHFQPIFQKYGLDVSEDYNRNNISDYLCPSLSDPFPTLQGAWNMQNFQILKIGVYSCQDSSTSKFSWNPKCKTDQEIREFLQEYADFRFQMITVNYIFNPSQSSNDIQPFLDVELFFSFVPDSMFVQADIFWRKKTVITDRGILMVPDLSTSVLPSRDSGDFRQQFSINQLTQGYYAAFYPQLSFYQYTINKSFFRLDQLLSYLGGFLQIVIVAVGLIVKQYNHLHMIVAMANDLFDFSDQTDNNVQKSMQKSLKSPTFSQYKVKLKNNKNELNPIATKLNSPIYNYDKVSDGPNSQYIQQQLQLNKSESIKVKSSKYFTKFKDYLYRHNFIGITFKYLISFVIEKESFLDNKSLMLMKATSQIQKELDIGFILKQLYEIEKLKQVLFEKDQMDLFNYSQKPIIVVNSTKKKRYSRMLSIYRRDGDVFDQDRKTYNDLVNSFRRLTSVNIEKMSNEQIALNYRLINLLGNELVQLIEQELAEFGDQSIEQVVDPSARQQFLDDNDKPAEEI